MKIINHRLCRDDDTPYPFRVSPNIGDTLKPEFLVMHYTAGRNFDQSVSWLVNPAAKASAHLVIGRDGSVVQLVPFNKVAWHAGSSSWQGYTGLNNYSIGIELDNVGIVNPSPTGDFRSWFGDAVPVEQVIQAQHKNETISRYWQLYTPEQLFVALEAAGTIIQQYGLKDILGHDDIAPGRKSDPGPAFPMMTFRSRLLGRSASVSDEGETYVTTANLHIRKAPDQTAATLPNSPLPLNTRLKATGMENGVWKEVEVLDNIKNLKGQIGWVHSRFIVAK
ncbi:negative regulator of beta-lactamase expression [Beggiatoa alba B18LD]|uniref:N-acetylmuramoyl-L-alanine amidase n=1 Tax=Beggiatoa alba B18LD TaxID=395493 RepID=I3CEN3_9GAMM|nr:N-acetylmuramoyl-L-alanine amidase [Beggiatoa alba]EIJ42076.1 negative regulator of beta-lactamase expression [Beggiatoa alba B18LD]